MSKRISVKLTREERAYYSNLFEMAAKDNASKIEGKDGAAFLKKSGLSREVLKNIWLKAAQTNLSWLERDEFYVALRLIALTQNDMPADEKSIINNDPIPPLAKFDLKIEEKKVEEESVNNLKNSMFSVNNPQNNNNNNNNFNNNSNLSMEGNMINSNTSDEQEITEQEYTKYNHIFNKHKDKSNPKVINFNTAFNIFTSARISHGAVEKGISIVNLQYPQEGFTRFEFIFILVLIYKAKGDPTKMPSAIPINFKTILSYVKSKQESEDITYIEIISASKANNLNNFNVNESSNMMNFSNNIFDNKFKDISDTKNTNINTNTSNNAVNSSIPNPNTISIDFKTESFNNVNQSKGKNSLEDLLKSEIMKHSPVIPSSSTQISQYIPGTTNIPNNNSNINSNSNFNNNNANNNMNSINNMNINSNYNKSLENNNNNNNINTSINSNSNINSNMINNKYPNTNTNAQTIDIKPLQNQINLNSEQTNTLNTNIKLLSNDELISKRKELYYLEEQLQQDNAVLVRLNDIIEKFNKENSELDNKIDLLKNKINETNKNISSAVLEVGYLQNKNAEKVKELSSLESKL